MQEVDTQFPSPTRVVCAWCEKILQDGEEPISHGICEECFSKIEEEKL